MQTHRGIILLLWGLVAIQLTCHQAAAKETPDSDTNLTPDQAGAPGSSGGASDGADPDSTVGTAEGNKPAAFETGEVDTLELGKPVDGGVSSTGNRAAPAGHKLILVADSTDRTITRLTTDDDNSYQWARYSIGNATNRPTAVDYDRTGDFVYWTSVNGANSRVSRFPYETGPGLRLDGGQASVPDGIAVDVISRNLYWTDTGTDRITVSRLDGSFRKSLITQGLDEPRAIVVDPNSGWMYWTDWGNPSKIERARMDGTQRSVIVNVVQGHWPNGLALDAAANRLYWCNGGTGEIWTSGVTGSNPSPAKLLTHANAHLFGIAVDETYIYWTAWNIPGVHRISKLLQGYLKLSIPHFQKLNDIHVRTTSNTPSRPNACSTSNGNCAQLCLPVPGGGRTCACQDGWSLGSDGRSCISAACRPNPCQNSGRCIGQDNSYTCDCQAGFSGVSCQININECASRPCQNGGQCRDGVNRYTCVCPAGFNGVNCQTNINECASSPCQNGGQCHDGVNRYTCVCPAGFNGVNCQTNINECASSPCQNGGRCVDGVNRYTCVCPAGFNGVNCQTNINECASSPCQNGGQCRDGVNRYTCVCPAGFSGVNCQININECASSPCQNGGQCHDGVNRYTCVCPAGFNGVNCQTNINECASSPCQNGGRCVDGVNRYTCVCPAGFNGVNCQTNINECASRPCQNGGRCVDGVNRYTCDCPDGFSGVNCQTNINECASRPCQNGGRCIDGVNRYTCDCRGTGFSGVNCQSYINECASSPCQNGGQCRDGVNRYTCVCPPGFSGVNCQIDDVCTPSPCQNGGRCVDGVNSYGCVCPDGFLGQRCEISATTAATTFASTGTSSVCESGWFHHEGKCYCLLEDQSTYSEAARTCADLDVYGQLAVVKRPSTHRFLMDYVQHVGGGSPWIGIDDSTTEGVWKYVDDVLVSDPFNEWAEGTWNSRKKDCVRMSETFGYHWQPMPCNSQLTYICEYPLQPPTDAPTPTPPDVERCEPDTCNQGGICIDGPSSYTCYCLPGYVGDNCETETNECEPNPCQNGGVCTDGRLSYTCKCPSGFGGVNCELTCPAGFRLFQDQCFWFSPTAVRKNVAAAETDCDARGARLACVKDEETHNFLKMTIATTNRRPYWIGLSDRVEEGTWRHSDGTALGSFRPFRPGNSNSVWRNCVLIWPASAYQWLYWNCGSRRNFICQKAASP
ncbi:fibropellin-1-like [Branchiostoma lanceolatum]|uniref:fibropellin-1-like n=1 Tax=Branchiostoma lanceolatum TaxID=7740 RepID=UPI0034516EF7